MTTAAQNQAAITAAIQTAATADLALLQTFASTYGPNFTTIQTGLATLAAGMSDLARANSVTQIANELKAALGDFQTLVSITNAAQTATPVA